MQWNIYLALKKNEILICATTRMNLENIMVNEISQTQKDQYVWLHIHEVIRIVRFIEIESRKEEGGGMGSYWLVGMEFQFRIMKKFWKWIVWWLHNIVNVLNAIKLYN